ncbi:class I SAM-dependent methyltransferase [Mycobacterium heidelbergense]|uniref:class I SAM-dependent methyltransferase n=1 Tax=Mycobacterium heidelbergense TaxID=53376 RepID=UPI003CF315E9
MTDSPTPAVNHHADHPGFAGPIGLVASLGMLVMGRRYAGLAVDLASVSDADRVVDVGCGPGNALRAAARRGATGVGIDPSPLMLRLACAVTRDHPNVSWSLGGAEELPVAAGWATVAWSLKTVHHWKDVTAGLAELRRVLASRGRLLVMERRVQPGATGLASHGWTEQQVESFAAQCRAAGFSDVRIDQHPAGRATAWVVRAVAP